jgi:type I restriction enzyme M protein
MTVDLAARRSKAAADALPFRETARAKMREADKVRDELALLKKAKPRDEAAIETTEASVRDLVKQSREATGKADDIENAVYDLKAVNPHRKPDVDRRTPSELLDLVEAKGVEIAEALKKLRAVTS